MPPSWLVKDSTAQRRAPSRRADAPGASAARGEWESPRCPWLHRCQEPSESCAELIPLTPPAAPGGGAVPGSNLHVNI